MPLFSRHEQMMRIPGPPFDLPEASEQRQTNGGQKDFQGMK